MKGSELERDSFLHVVLLLIATQDCSFCIFVFPSFFSERDYDSNPGGRLPQRHSRSKVTIEEGGHSLTNTFPVSQRNCVTETPFAQTKITVVDTLADLCVRVCVHVEA